MAPNTLSIMSQMRRQSWMNSDRNDQTPHLGPINTESESSHEKFETTVVVIPEFDSMPIKATWSDGYQVCWLQSVLAGLCSDPRVLCFEPLLLSDRFSWQKLASWGDQLIEELFLIGKRDVGFYNRPLFLIAHGLGGLVLKRCLAVLIGRFYDAAYGSLLSVVTGVVFLGTPSPKVDNPRHLDQVDTLLKAVSKESRKSLDKPGTQSSAISTAHVSQDFANSGLEPSVLSVYETKLSKIKRNVFSARQILVGRNLCETTTKRERLLGIGRSHQQLCSIGHGDKLQIERMHFFTLAMELKQLSIKLKRSFYHEDTATVQSVLELDSISVSGCYTQADEMSWERGFSTLSLGGMNGSSHDMSKELDRQSVLPCYVFGSQERNVAFRGRDYEIGLIEKALIPLSGIWTNIHAFALCGVGGLGKTQLAAEFMYSRKVYFDAIFWIHAADTATLAK